MKKVVFLDRDGTVNQEVDYLSSVRELRLIRGAAAAIRAFNRMGFLVIIVTNQPVIARGWIDVRGLEGIHRALLKRLSRQGAKVEAIYYCPHLPPGHPYAELAEYRQKCSCRKPEIGLLNKVAHDFTIDFRKSFMIGDSTRDILTGKNANLKTILVETGYAGKDGKFNVIPEFVTPNLAGAVKIIKNHAR